MRASRQFRFGRIVPSSFLALGTIRQELMSSQRCDDRYAQLDRRDAGEAFRLLPFLPE
jgi:hypothetical protein